MSKLFENPDDAGFMGRIAEKLYRLANVENNNKGAVLNESIQDTEVDICVITALWMASRMERRQKNQCETTQACDSGEPIQTHAQEARIKDAREQVTENEIMVRITSDMNKLHTDRLYNLNQYLSNLIKTRFDKADASKKSY